GTPPDRPAGADGADQAPPPSEGGFHDRLRARRMIAVTGEVLIDLIADPDGCITPRLGGGPFNTARAIGRLGLAVAFLGRLSADRFGRQLQASLDADGVTLVVPGLTDAPTTLAVVDLDPAGSPRFRFYLDGPSAPALDYPAMAAALPGGLTALYAGGLALVMEPIATSIDRVVGSDLPPGALLMIDPNVRPEVIGDREAYLARLSRILHRAAVVKITSAEPRGPGRGRRPAGPGARARADDRRPSPGAGPAARRGTDR